MAERLLAENIDSFVVKNFKLPPLIAPDDTVVAVRIVRIESNISDDAERRMRGLERADGAGDKSFVVKGFLGQRRFESILDFWKKHDGRNSQSVGLASLTNQTC